MLVQIDWMDLPGRTCCNPVTVVCTSGSSGIMVVYMQTFLEEMMKFLVLFFVTIMLPYLLAQLWDMFIRIRDPLLFQEWKDGYLIRKGEVRGLCMKKVK